MDLIPKPKEYWHVKYSCDDAESINIIVKVDKVPKSTLWLTSQFICLDPYGNEILVPYPLFVEKLL